MRLSPRLMSWIAATGLIAVLGAGAAFEIVTHVESSTQLHEVQAATLLAAAYSQARFEVARTAEASNLYVLSPTPDNRVELNRRLTSTLVAAEEVRRLGGPEDVRLIDSLEDPVKLETIQRYYDLLAEGQDAGATAPYPGWSTELVDALVEPQQAQAAQAEATLENYVERGDRRTKAMFVVLGAGLVVVLALFLLQRALVRREAEVEMEIRRLRTVAVSDPLTGLGNRRAFEEASTSKISGEAHTLTLAMIDLDGFKVINDTWGHTHGDATLRAVADALRDFLPPGARAFRIGGDEFAALLPGIGTAEAEVLMDGLRDRVAEELSPASISIGIATHPAAEVDHVLLCQEADSALYHAKRRGRNVVVPYAASLDSVPLFRASNIQAVQRLLNEGGVRTVFQPIWRLSPRTVFGYEALTRIDPSYDLDGIQDAFDIAEQLGQAAELDAICRRSTIAAAASLPPGALLFMNVSPFSLANCRFSAATLLDELAPIHLDPRRVVIEVTERSTVAPTVVARAARELRKAGFAIALDDVGAGNIGLAMLQQVPFDYLKVDREIVIGAQVGGSARAALRAVLAFGAEVGAQVLVEGVETDDQLTFVEQMAGQHLRRNAPLIQLVQGYLLGRPAPGFTTPQVEPQAA